MRFEFDVPVNNLTYKGWVLLLEGCVWVWVGEEGAVRSIGLSHFPLSSMIMDTPDTMSMCVKAATTRIAKQFKNKQVFFSSDIGSEEPRFWQELISALLPVLEEKGVHAAVEAMSIQEAA